MLRPAAFCRPYITARNVPYSGSGQQSMDASHDGVLSAGQLVWAEQGFVAKASSHAVVGFVEDVGMISIDARWLKEVRGDGSGVRRSS